MFKAQIILSTIGHTVVVSSSPLGEQIGYKIYEAGGFQIFFRADFFLTAISDCTETVTKVSIRVCNVAFKLRKQKHVKGTFYTIYLVILGSCRVAVSSLRHFKVTVGLSGSTSPP